MFTWLHRPKKRDRRRWSTLISFTAGKGAALCIQLQVHRVAQRDRAPPAPRLWRVMRIGGGKGHLVSGGLKGPALALLALSESVIDLERVAGPVQIVEGLEMDILA